MKIFGREPTIVLQAVSALLALGVAFGMPNLSAEQAGVIVAVLSAVLAAANSVMVKPFTPAAFVGVVTSGAALLAAYGLDLTQQQVGSVTAVVIGVLTLLVRGQVTPVADPRSPETVVG